MKTLRLLAVPLIALPLTLALGQAPALMPGSKAPKIEVKRWLKGTPVRTTLKKGTYVIEFWATWCAPCRESIPHLTELARKHKKTKFAGIGIWEADGKHIDKFVKDMGSKMGYAVAYSGNRDAMAKTWMASAKQTGIPSAFIIKDGVIQWIGLPWEMEDALTAVEKGTLDLNVSKRDFLNSLNTVAQSDESKQELAAIAEKFLKGERDEAKADLKAFESKHPVKPESPDFVTLEIRRLHLFWLAFDSKDQFLASVSKILENEADIGRVAVVPPVILQLSSNEASYELASEAIKVLTKGTKDPEVFRFAAIVCRRMNQPSECARYAQLGLDLLKDKTGEDAETTRKQLRQYIDPLH